MTMDIDAWVSENRELYGLVNPPSTRPLDDETIERLKSLGYVN